MRLTPYQVWSLKAISLPCVFLCAAVSAKFPIKGIKTCTSKRFEPLHSLLPIMCEHIYSQFSRMTGAELNHFSLERLHKLPPSHSPHRKSWMRYGVSLRERERERREKKKHCGAIMRAYCEVRVGTVSEGMSRLARLVLLQRRVCWRGFILNWDFMSEGYPFVCSWRGWQIPGSLFSSKGGLSSPQEAKEASHARQSKPDTWGKQRCQPG